MIDWPKYSFNRFKPKVHPLHQFALAAELRDRLRELTRRSTTWRAPGKIVREINQVTRGWGNYFGLASAQGSFGQLNHFVAHRLRQWLWRKHGNPSRRFRRWPDRQLVETYGLYKLPTYWA